jgi:hypothetical protein
MEDRRKFERFALNVPARVGVPGKRTPEDQIALETDNLSAGGIFLKSVKPSLTEGVPVKVEIFLHFEELKAPENPDGTLIITATGSVQRSGDDGTAISLNEDYDILTIGEEK